MEYSGSIEYCYELGFPTTGTKISDQASNAQWAKIQARIFPLNLVPDKDDGVEDEVGDGEVLGAVLHGDGAGAAAEVVQPDAHLRRVQMGGYAMGSKSVAKPKQANFLPPNWSKLACFCSISDQTLDWGWWAYLYCYHCTLEGFDDAIRL